MKDSKESQIPQQHNENRQNSTHKNTKANTIESKLNN
jgi:hypothetical protein